MIGNIPFWMPVNIFSSGTNKVMPGNIEHAMMIASTWKNSRIAASRAKIRRKMP